MNENPSVLDIQPMLLANGTCTCGPTVLYDQGAMNRTTADTVDNVPGDDDIDALR